MMYPSSISRVSNNMRSCLWRGLASAIAPKFARSFSATAKDSKSNGIKIDFQVPYETYKCESPPNWATTTREELLHFYTEMTRIRRLETAADALYKQKLIRGFCHLYNGQEAVAVGLESSINKKDFVITAYRDHGFILTRGCPAKDVLAELMMRTTGCSKGKGGSMHMFDLKNGFYGGHGIVGAQTPLGAGLAFTQKYLNTGNIAITLYGDGAANQGQLYESFNMAQLWKLPVVFVCENNQYAMGTSVDRASADHNYFTRAHFIPGLKVDGMNVLAVKNAMKFAADHARGGSGPVVVEVSTYRYVGHSMSDPGTTYRTRDEVQAMRAQRDPIDKVKTWLLQYQLATEEELKAIEQKARQEMDDATEYARASAEPALREMYTHVYQETVPVRGVELSNSFTP